MLALQSAPLHLRDQDKQERFDQPLLFTSYLHHQTSNSSTSTSSGLSARHHHPRHHSYHHPVPTSLSAAACLVPALMPHSQQHNQHHPHQLVVNKHLQHQALFYRECDLKQDLSIAHTKIASHNTTISASSNKNVVSSNGFTSSMPSMTWVPRIQSDDNTAFTTSAAASNLTPIHKIESRIAQMTIEDCAKEKIVLLLTGKDTDTSKLIYY
ncbi:hypothetical protein FBU30_007474 [Linnemannia zychae]|nr:hypothetical protein FBU30_007474 [Linnemannia zychae]